MLAQTNILTHPITLIIIGAGITGIGWVIGILISLIRDNAKLTQATGEISEILKHVLIRADKTDYLLSEIKNDLSELVGEHRAMVRAGNLISTHNQKKS